MDGTRVAINKVMKAGVFALALCMCIGLSRGFRNFPVPGGLKQAMKPTHLAVHGETLKSRRDNTGSRLAHIRAGESTPTPDTVHKQYLFMDGANSQAINSIKSKWANAKFQNRVVAPALGFGMAYTMFLLLKRLYRL